MLNMLKFLLEAKIHNNTQLSATSHFQALHLDNTRTRLPSANQIACMSRFSMRQVESLNCRSFRSHSFPLHRV